MRKTAGIGFLIALLFPIGGSYIGMAAAKAPALSELRKVVLDYYKAYIAYQQYDLKKEDKTLKPVPDRSLHPVFVTRYFADSYRKLKAENDKLTPEGEVGPLDYDPIICGQDVPDNIAGTTVVLVKTTGTEASVRVGLGGFTPPAPPFIVKLKKQAQGWRIDSIACNGKDFDSLYQGMKKDEKPKK